LRLKVSSLPRGHWKLLPAAGITFLCCGRNATYPRTHSLEFELIENLEKSKSL